MSKNSQQKKKILHAVVPNKILLSLGVFLLSLAFLIVLGYKQNSNTKKPTPLIPSGTTNVDPGVKSPINKPKNYPVEPTILGNQLTSPFIKDNSPAQKFKVSWSVIDGWEFGGYEFTWCELEQGVCEYNLHITHKQNKGYGINFKIADTSFGDCYFGQTDDEDKLSFSVFIRDYKEIETGFGNIRVGKSDKNETLWICQNDVSSLGEKRQPSDWVYFTEIGFVEIVTPEKAKQELIDQMLEIVRLTKKIQV